ncbi:hypothetical protein ACFQZ4_36435 [Catellatospora coxensis]
MLDTKKFTSAPTSSRAPATLTAGGSTRSSGQTLAIGSRPK